MNIDDIRIERLHEERGYNLEEVDNEIYCDITGEIVNNEYIVFQEEKVIKYESDLLELLKGIFPFGHMKNDESILYESWELLYWYYKEK